MKIIINEAQEKYVCEKIIQEEILNFNEKVLIVKKFLDKNFKRADISQFGDDGYSTIKPIVVYLDSYKQPIKKLTDDELLEMLIDKFQNLTDNESELKTFLIKIMKSWYYKDKKLELGIV